MSDFNELLEAAIRHVEAMKRRGVRGLQVDPNVLQAMAAPPVPRSSATRLSSIERTKPASSPPSSSMPHTPIRASSTAADPPGTIAEAALPIHGGTIPIPPEPAPMSREAKEAAMAEVRARALACQRCPNLAASRRTVVFGVGDIHSPLMFVGEAPGMEEDERGEPFVGKAGQLLTRIIQTMGLSRETVYIANILKCRPDTPGESSGNRKPTPDEMNTCIPYLLEQIELIRPRVIVALGATAVEGMLGKTIGITKLRGTWREFRSTPVMPTYHPAFLLRNQSLAVKRQVWEDMLQVMQKLGMEITDKQRAYFLNT